MALSRLHQPGGLLNPGWFRIERRRQEEHADHDGWLHISGWMHTSIKTNPVTPGSDGWLSLGICPICHALVITEQHRPVPGDHQWAHEAWHARTDFPVPAELLTDEDRRRGYAPREAS